jgi:hypothetical protein
VSVHKPPIALPGGRLAYERAIRRSGLPASARHLALTLATWADIGTGVIPERFQPSISVLADATGLGTATVKRHLSTLESGGWLGRDRPEISRARAEHARTQYALRVPVATEGHGSERAMPGSDGAMAWPTASQEHGSEGAKAWPTTGHKSPCSSDESPPPSPPAPPSAAGPPPAGPREGGREDAPHPTPEEQGAAEALARAVADVPQLALGAREIARLAPLVVPWLARTTEAALRDALTAGLPAVVGNPAGIVRRRLLDKLPPVAAPPRTGGGLPPWCGRCGDGMPAEFNARFRVLQDGALCGCHPDAA